MNGIFEGTAKQTKAHQPCSEIMVWVRMSATSLVPPLAQGSSSMQCLRAGGTYGGKGGWLSHGVGWAHVDDDPALWLHHLQGAGPLPRILILCRLVEQLLRCRGARLHIPLPQLVDDLLQLRLRGLLGMPCTTIASQQSKDPAVKIPATICVGVVSA